MSYLSQMYGKNKPTQTQSSSDKNPNRVTGGLKGQGVDHLVMVAEDGNQQQIPTLKYVQSLEEQIRKQRAAINVLERKVTRQEANIGTLQTRRG
jgi:hypothetical protein